jgi:hypothetical protein
MTLSRVDIQGDIAERLGFAKGFPDALRLTNGRLKRWLSSVQRLRHSNLQKASDPPARGQICKMFLGRPFFL